MNPRNRAIAAGIVGVLVLAIFAALVVAATGSDDESSLPTVAPTTDDTTPSTLDATTTESTPEATELTTSTAPESEPLRVLVTNDDGVGATGIDALVQALTNLEGVEVTVVAPAENQSGTGDTLTDGALNASETTIASGYPAVAVDGTPGDSIVWAIDQEGIAFVPHVVVSGSNEGQNLGPVAQVSGTVGAARTASRRGIPALAVSQGFGDPPDYAASVQAAVAWVVENRDALITGTTDPAVVSKIDAPTCVAGTVKGVVEVPLATDIAERNYLAPVDCTVEAPPTADDIDAFLAGHVALTTFDADLSVLQPAA